MSDAAVAPKKPVEPQEPTAPRSLRGSRWFSALISLVSLLVLKLALSVKSEFWGSVWLELGAGTSLFLALYRLKGRRLSRYQLAILLILSSVGIVVASFLPSKVYQAFAIEFSAAGLLFALLEQWFATSLDEWSEYVRAVQKHHVDMARYDEEYGYYRARQRANELRKEYPYLDGFQAGRLAHFEAQGRPITPQLVWEVEGEDLKGWLPVVDEESMYGLQEQQ